MEVIFWCVWAIIIAAGLAREIDKTLYGNWRKE